MIVSFVEEANQTKTQFEAAAPHEQIAVLTVSFTIATCTHHYSLVFCVTISQLNITKAHMRLF